MHKLALLALVLIFRALLYLIISTEFLGCLHKASLTGLLLAQCLVVPKHNAM